MKRLRSQHNYAGTSARMYLASAHFTGSTTGESRGSDRCCSLERSRGKCGFSMHRRAPPTGKQGLGRSAMNINAVTSLNTERSEEHTSELQSHSDLVCRLLLEKKKI